MRDVVGVYRDGATREHDGRLQAEAVLRVFEHAERLAGMVRESLELATGELLGLSIDGLAVVKAGSRRRSGGVCQ